MTGDLRVNCCFPKIVEKLSHADQDPPESLTTLCCLTVLTASCQQFAQSALVSRNSFIAFLLHCFLLVRTNMYKSITSNAAPYNYKVLSAF